MTTNSDNREIVFVTATTAILRPQLEKVEFQGLVNLPYTGIITISLDFTYGIILSTFSNPNEESFESHSDYPNKYRFFLTIPADLSKKAIKAINQNLTPVTA